MWCIIGLFILASFLPNKLGDILFGSLFFLLGGLCLFNYNRCGRVHCQITGYGFIAVGVLALMEIMNILKTRSISIYLK